MYINPIHQQNETHYFKEPMRLNRGVHTHSSTRCADHFEQYSNCYRISSGDSQNKILLHNSGINKISRPLNPLARKVKICSKVKLCKDPFKNPKNPIIRGDDKSAFSAVNRNKSASALTSVLTTSNCTSLENRILNIKHHQVVNSEESKISIENSEERSASSSDSHNLNINLLDFPSSNKPSVISNKIGDVGAKSSRGLNSRPDVVLKTILRNFKKYYVSEFKKFSGFKNSKRVRYDTHEILDKAEAFVTNKFKLDKTKESPLFLLSLIDFKFNSDELNARHKHLCSLISSLLYSFNKNKLCGLFDMADFCIFLLHFLNQNSLIHQVTNDVDEDEIVRVYNRQTEYLKENCERKLNQVSM